MNIAPYNPLGEEEALATAEVLKSGLLSDFLGFADDRFFGGKKVREFESAWGDYHQVKHVASFNSASSALIAAVGAAGVVPGDEVLVVPNSMCISATAPLFYGAIPVFVDVEHDTFCMDPRDVERRITPRTRAIIAVDLCGQSADMIALREIARRHNLKIISDAAHVPGCGYLNGFAGTFAEIGVYSFNQHKIVHCGEGGAAVTNDDDIAMKLRLIRNHGENVVDGFGITDLRNAVGGNFRLPEMEAAIMVEQTKKLPKLIEQRVDLARYLSDRLAKFDFVAPPKVREGSSHVYYLYAILYRKDATGIDRETFVSRLKENGMPVYRLTSGYIRPLYLEPIFQRKDEFQDGYPFKLNGPAVPSYASGTCPTAEKLYAEELIATAFTYPPLTRDDMDFIARCFEKAARNIS